MDLKSLNRAVLISSSVLYSVNVILSISLFSILLIKQLPIANPDIKAILTAVPLISGVFNALILGMISMSLKYAEYYGLIKSILALIIYSAYWIAFSPPLDILIFIISIMALCVMQIGVLYLYARIQKEMFG
ncbi:hypothetical protein GWK48_00250 [Metallosphaera tengchongensis]|uniref:Uncharacterized protein n=1 Tax=Metallosphaera tengchongensis TaxID=1532350 RepID=A0A6N0NV73_9CREN|nr:hypothetical protein [Metallosphaera tengchongensis]QKQ99030.1 hypothetical protein GWK48_00250 [Metallosphaera tengchongensis]